MGGEGGGGCATVLFVVSDGIAMLMVGFANEKSHLRCLFCSALGGPALISVGISSEGTPRDM